MDAAGSTHEAISRYAPDIEIPPPVVLDQARRNLKLQAAMLKEFGAINASELAALAGSRARRTTTTVDNWRRAHKVVAVRWRDESMVPGFLLTHEAQPDPVARPALQTLAGQGSSDWQAALWWVIPSRALDGRRPVDVLLAGRDCDPSARSIAAEQLRTAAERRRDWF